MPSAHPPPAGSRAAMNKHWQTQKMRAAAKRLAIQSRADELAAIEQHLAEHGITKGPDVEPDETPLANYGRPQPLPGWR